MIISTNNRCDKSIKKMSMFRKDDNDCNLGKVLTGPKIVSRKKLSEAEEQDLIDKLVATIGPATSELLETGKVVYNNRMIVIEDVPEILEEAGYVMPDHDHIIQGLREIDITKYYTKIEVDIKIQELLDSHYNKEEVDELINQIDLVPATRDDLGVVMVGDGLDVTENGLLSINKTFYDYLLEATYKKPSLSLNIAGFPTSSQEVGYSYKGIKSINYSIINNDNIVGDLTLSGHGGNALKVPPKTGSIDVDFNLTSNSPSTSTVLLSCKDIKNTNITTSKSFTTLFPLFAGWAGSSVSKNEVYNLTSFMSSNVTSIKGVYNNNNSSTRYLWICVPSDKSITTVTANGFGTVLNDPVVISITNKYNVTTNYKCYRISDMLDLNSDYDLIVVR